MTKERNRKIPPPIHKVEHVDLVKPEKVSDRYPFFVEHNKGFEATKVELLFKAGSKYQNKKLAAKMCADLLLSGTDKKSADTISRQIDQLGGFTKVEPSKDFLSVQFYGLTQNMPAILEVGITAIDQVVFPKKEWDEQLNISRSALEQSLEKVSVMARRSFYRELYSGTSYDTIADLEDYEKITREDVLQFHRENCHNAAPAVFVSGGFSNAIQAFIENYLIRFEHQFEQPKGDIFEPEIKPLKITQEGKKGAIQNALRLGRKMWTQQHEDRISFSVLNTTLGGYFGSRLMTNIREEKGYTYGIGSFYISHQEMGVWGIVTEVGSDYTKDTFQEIEKELIKLKEELLTDEELNRVKSYMIGQFLRATDGTFAVMDQFKRLWLQNEDFQELDQWLYVVQKTKAEDVQAMAEKYFNIENMIVVNAGVPTTFR